MMRTMEPKQYAGNSAFLNSGTFDLQNQVNMKSVQNLEILLVRFNRGNNVENKTSHYS